jgi:hypothetical protein
MLLRKPTISSPKLVLSYSQPMQHEPGVLNQRFIGGCAP